MRAQSHVATRRRPRRQKKSHSPNKDLVRAWTLPFAIISRHRERGHVGTKLLLLYLMTAFKVNNQRSSHGILAIVYDGRDKVFRDSLKETGRLDDDNFYKFVQAVKTC